MKKGTNNKRKLILLILTCALALAGYIAYKPVLKNADKPFIDLSGTVGDAMGNSQKAYVKLNPSSTPKPTQVIKPTSTPRPTVTPATRVEIKVFGEMITDGKVYYDDAAGFVTAFESGVYKGKSVVLIDDYADSKTYKRLLKLFRENGVNFREERR